MNTLLDYTFLREARPGQTNCGQGKQTHASRRRTRCCTSGLHDNGRGAEAFEHQHRIAPDVIAYSAAISVFTVLRCCWGTSTLGFGTRSRRSLSCIFVRLRQYGKTLLLWPDALTRLGGTKAETLPCRRARSRCRSTATCTPSRRERTSEAHYAPSAGGGG